MIKTTAFALVAAGALLSGTAAFAAQDTMSNTTTTTTHTKKAAKPHKAKMAKTHTKTAKK